jgi:hypothetical protein
LHLGERPDHDVGGLQVAVQDSLGVRVRHGLAHLLEDGQKSRVVSREP